MVAPVVLVLHGTTVPVEPVVSGSTSPVTRLPGDTSLAQGKRPPVTSPTGGTPLEVAVSVAAAKPVGLFLSTHLSLFLLAGCSPGIGESQRASQHACVRQVDSRKGASVAGTLAGAPGGGTGGSAGNLARGCSSGLSRSGTPS
eukprot:6489264-Amphidinium_carterae.3